MSDLTSTANVERVLKRWDEQPLSEFRAVASAQSIRCARCKGTAVEHGPRGECNRLRGGYQPYSLRLSY